MINNSFLTAIILCIFQLFISETCAQIDSFVVKPYLQNGEKNAMHIIWETALESTTTVEYAKAKLNANEAIFDQSITKSGVSKLHEVRLESLDVATKYIYRVKSITQNGDTLISDVSTFKTNVKDDDAYYFAFIGDSQRNNKTPWAWGKIADKVWQERPNFIVHAGDLVDVGTRKEDWTGHFLKYGNVAMRRYPMYSVLGNHEQDAQYYYDYMANPAPEYYYTFLYGNAQFFMIDTNRDVTEGSEQYDWLEWALAESNATWKFVVHHHPPYSSEENDHGDTYIGQSSYRTHARNLVPLYEQYGVDFCLFGHTHVYERTWPIMQDAINKKNGVVYINSGGAGGGLEDFDPVRSWFSKEMQTGHHYCTFAVHDNSLQFRAIDQEGNLFDSFELEKEVNSNVSMINTPAPHFKVDKLIFEKTAKAELLSIDTSIHIYYTLDGTTPNQQSHKYQGPIVMDRSATLMAVGVSPDGLVSRTVQRVFTKMKPQASINPSNTKRGLKFAYYEGHWDYLPDFDTLIPLSSGTTLNTGIEDIEHRENNFAIVMEGYLEVSATDTYTFFTYSDDGSKLYINDEVVVDSDGNHSAKYIYGTTILEKGKHKIKLEYFEGGGNNFLYAGTVNQNDEKIPFTPFQLSHN